METSNRRYGSTCFLKKLVVARLEMFEIFFEAVCKVSHFGLTKNVFCYKVVHNEIIEISHRY